MVEVAGNAFGYEIGVRVRLIPIQVGNLLNEKFLEVSEMQQGGVQIIDSVFILINFLV